MALPPFRQPPSDIGVVAAGRRRRQKEAITSGLHSPTISAWTPGCQGRVEGTRDLSNIIGAARTGRHLILYLLFAPLTRHAATALGGPIRINTRTGLLSANSTSNQIPRDLRQTPGCGDVRWSPGRRDVPGSMAGIRRQLSPDQRTHGRVYVWTDNNRCTTARGQTRMVDIGESDVVPTGSSGGMIVSSCSTHAVVSISGVVGRDRPAVDTASDPDGEPPWRLEARMRA
jgi:hypothetical protein